MPRESRSTIRLHDWLAGFLDHWLAASEEARESAPVRADPAMAASGPRRQG